LIQVQQFCIEAIGNTKEEVGNKRWNTTVDEEVEMSSRAQGVVGELGK
jgi:hypothetical protein